jgi:hypothetical protein
MQWLDNALATTGGKVTAGVVVVVVFASLYVEIRNTVNPPAAAAMYEVSFICSQTGQVFKHAPQKGESIPVYSPFSGANTGYPAEFCYWTADGQIKSTPTPVLLNSWIGKSGPTFCPDCGRLVVSHNPFPSPGDKPPPTREEYERRHATSGQ